MTVEIWKDVAGTTGFQVSSLGRARKTGSHGEVQYLKGSDLDGGRRAIRIRRAGQLRRVYIHRLVLEAFVGPCPPGLQCCHADDDVTNNRLENLRWDTHKANIHDAIRNGRMRRGSQHAAAKLTEEQVARMRVLMAAGKSVSSVARKFRVSASTASHIRLGLDWRHVTGGVPLPPGKPEPIRRRAPPSLTGTDVIVMRYLMAQGESDEDLADEFGVSVVKVRQIRQGELWKRVTGGAPIPYCRQVSDSYADPLGWF